MKRKALLVGINDYAPAGTGGPDLRGCVNDVRDFANTISALGVVPIAPRNMKVLTNRLATRANIISGLTWLLSGAQKDDVLVFYYSGHGTYLADTSGDELDRRDEAICPHDYATAGPIVDDNLRALISGLAPGANLDVFLDSCFSGTGTRLLAAGESPTAANAEFTSRFVQPPIDQSLFVDAEPSLPVRSFFGSGSAERGLVAAPNMNHVLWAGCRDNETSGEGTISGAVRGYFTYALCKCLRGAGPTVTRAKLDSLVSLYLSNMGVRQQHPQTEGPRTALAERVFS